MNTSKSQRVVIAQCTNDKRDGQHRAADLYDESTYFRKQREYARTADRWFIQSAKYGLLDPDKTVESYDRHAKDIDNPEVWAESIADDLEAAIPSAAVVELLGGAAYADPLTPELERRGFDVVEPLRGLGIGERMAHLQRLQNTRLEGFA